MIGILKFALYSIVIAISIAIPAVFLEFFLIRAGIVRNRMVILISGILFLVFIKRIWFDDLSWSFIGPMIIILGILAINRGDLWTTMSRGRWWWKSNQ